MSNALRDQLLKAGLVNDKQAKKAAKEQRKEANQRHGQQQNRQAEEEARREAQRAQQEKAERDRQLNQQRQQAAAEKALSAQVRQLADTNQVPDADGDIAFNFTDGANVKRIYVNEPARKRLSDGLLAIIKVDGRYRLVPRETAEKIRTRLPSSLILLNEPKRTGKPAAADDPYAGFEVPDDLMW